MPRDQKPLDPDDGPLAAFAHDLRQLREKAGNPPYRALAKRAGFAASTLSVAASGTVLPSQDVTLAYVQACGGDPEPWRLRWHQLAAQVDSQSRPSPDLTVPEPSTEPARPRWRWLPWLAVPAAVVVAAVVALNTVGGQQRPPQPVAQYYQYDRTVGPGCQEAPDARTTKDDFTVDHHWTTTTAVDWTVQNCADIVLYSQPTDATNLNRWQDDYYWYFDDVPADAECTFHIYIPDTGYSHYLASYDWTTGAENYLDANLFLVQQDDYLGRWYDRGPFRFATGQAQMLLTDARNAGTDGTMTAAVVRLTCRAPESAGSQANTNSSPTRTRPGMTTRAQTPS